jgi:hypothetical protein
MLPKEFGPFVLVQTTDNNSLIKELKQFALDNDYIFYNLGNKREDMKELGSIYKTNNRALCFIPNIDKSRVSDALLTITERGREDFILIASYYMLEQQSPLVQRSMNVSVKNENIEEGACALCQMTLAVNHKKILSSLKLTNNSKNTIEVIDYLKALLKRFYTSADEGVTAKNITIVCDTIKKISIPNINKEVEIMGMLDNLE